MALRPPVRSCRKTEFNLIIMDLMMPVCDGIESTKLIRQFEAETCRRPTQIVGRVLLILEEQVII